MVNEIQEITHIDWSRYEKIREQNNEVIRLYAAYLTNCSTFITKDLINELVLDCQVTEEYAFAVLLEAIFGLDAQRNENHRIIMEQYIIPSVKRLDVNTYYKNLYYQTIRIPEQKIGNWELKKEMYEEYEGFIYDDIQIRNDYQEMPCLGFFTEEFQFPVILENGVEWMTVTPNEINTMQPVIDKVSGKVITYGLGLGYFAFMVSEKESVDSITIVEKYTDIIKLFEEVILPQFPHKEKVTVIQADAFEYAEKEMSKQGFDYAFVDIWHDASDGLPKYLKMKKLEYLCPDTKYDYWIEESLKSAVRWQMYEELNNICEE